MGRQKAALWLPNSQYGGLEGEECENRRQKTQSMLNLSAENMAVPMCSGFFRDLQHLSTGEGQMSAHDRVCIYRGQQMKYPAPE